MRQALLAFSILLAACGGAAETTSTTAVVPSAPPPTASDSAAVATPPTPTSSTTGAPTTPPPAGQAFCPALGGISFVGGQGTSIADAVRIVGARGESDGVASEYACLDAAFGSRRKGKWKLLRQSLVGKDGKNFDVMSVELPDGTKKDVYFDISDYFGKF